MGLGYEREGITTKNFVPVINQFFDGDSLVKFEVATQLMLERVADVLAATGDRSLNALKEEL